MIFNILFYIMLEKEKLVSNEQKDELKDLLEDLASSIKSKEEVSGIDTEVDEKILALSSQIESLKTQNEFEWLLNEVKEELQVLKEYKAFKELLTKLEKKVDQLTQKVTSSTKKQIQSFAKREGLILDNPKLAKKLANEWRSKAASEIEKGIVAKLAERDDWIWKLAKKALG